MEADTSCTGNDEVDRSDFDGLVEAFGSVFSLEDITSAYHRTGSNVDMAGEILWGLQGSTSRTATFAFKDEFEGGNAITEVSSELKGSTSASSELLQDNNLQKSYFVERKAGALKSKKSSISMGTVSGVIGKEYIRPKPITNVFSGGHKPLKLDSKKFPMHEIWNEEVESSMAADKNTMHNDVAEFMFKMLGEGFQLGMNVIQEVLGHCGYDVQKSLEKLIDLSASSLEKYDDVVGVTGQKSAEKSRNSSSLIHHEQLKHLDPAKSNERSDLQREVLESLFSVPERIEEKPRKWRPLKERKTFGKPLVKPLNITIAEYKTTKSELKEASRNEDEDTEDSYDELRKAVKEYWIIMKEYYKAAADAFAEGDHARANKLLEQGMFYQKKARESDEKSVQKLLETSSEADDRMHLDLSAHNLKEAIRLLKLHLTSLSGIPSIRYLELVLGTDDADTTKGARKRLIKKFLAKESIKWTEEGNGQNILITMDVINPKHLSFAKKNH